MSARARARSGARRRSLSRRAAARQQRDSRRHTHAPSASSASILSTLPRTTTSLPTSCEAWLALSDAAAWLMPVRAAAAAFFVWSSPALASVLAPAAADLAAAPTLEKNCSIA